MENRTVKERDALVSKDNANLSVRKQCKILGITRSNLYYQHKGAREQNLEVMRLMDKIYLDNPTYGVLRMQDELIENDLYINVKRVRRLMSLMRLEAIYPKPSLSKLGRAEYIYPYLLRKLEIKKPNKVWSIDITYIAMAKGFMYLTAIIDVYSRYIVGWKLSNTLDKESQTEILEECISNYGTPELALLTEIHWNGFICSSAMQSVIY